jgi:hypothetical protein
VISLHAKDFPDHLRQPSVQERLSRFCYNQKCSFMEAITPLPLAASARRHYRWRSAPGP